jgi:hypothetical protein
VNVIIDPLLSGPKELKKVDSPVFAGLADTQQHQIITDATLSRMRLDYIAQCCESLYRVFRIVVVPWNIIVVQKGKELSLVSSESFLSLPREFGLVLACT